MAFRPPVLMAFLSSVFLFTGLMVNAAQLLTLVFVWPFSKTLYRHINVYLVTFLWTEMTWLPDYWANVSLRIFAEPEVFKALGNESAVAILNHRSDLDWMIGWMIADRFKILGGAKCLIKKELGLLPIIGWSWWFMEYVLLSRDWQKDRDNLVKVFKRFANFPSYFWFVIFAEGTRFTEEKLKKSNAYCEKNGMAPFKNVLAPRTKGFTLMIAELRPNVKAVYDVTIAFPGGVPPLPDWFRGRSHEIQVYIRRTPVEDIPDTDEGANDWCIDCYRKMDNRLEEFKVKGFPGMEHPLKKRLLSSVLLLIGITMELAFLAFLFIPLLGIPYFFLALGLCVLGGDVLIRIGMWFVNRRTPATSKKAK
eukprot:m.72650 g.72650  ORF g.72650 m.72650 type:complete len:364 (-) comp20275_c0_seq3:50-1141(-)